MSVENDAAPQTITLSSHDEGIAVRHACNRLLMTVTRQGIELHCDKCHGKVLHTWRQVLVMMLTMEMGSKLRPTLKGPDHKPFNIA